MDLEILTSKLDKRVFNSLHSRIEQIPAKSRLLAFLKAAQQLTEEFIAETSVFQEEEGILLLRFAVRISFLTGDNDWILQLNSEDPVFRSIRTFLIPNQNPKELIQIQQHILQNFDSEQDPEGPLAQITILSNLLQAFGGIGDINQVRQVELEARKIYQDINTEPLAILSFCYLIGFATLCHLERGNLKEVERLNSELQTLALELGSNILNGFVAAISGNLNLSQGHLEKALTDFENVTEITRSLENIQGTAGTMNNIALILMDLGRFKEANQVLGDALKLISGLKSATQLQIVLESNLAAGLQSIGDLKEALVIAKRMYESEKSRGTITFLFGRSCAVLASILIDLEEYDEAQQILDELKGITEEVGLRHIQIKYNYELGRLEMQKRNVGKAEEAFMRAHQYATQSVSLDALLKIQLQFARLYIQEYRITDDFKFLRSAGNYLENLIQAATEQDFIFMLCRALIIRSNIEALQEEYGKALTTLNEALILAKKDLPMQKEGILDNIKLIQTKRDKRISYQDRKQSFMGRIKSHLGEAFKIRFSKKPKQINTKIYGVIILSQTGLPAYSRYLDENLSKDTMLISGLISAILTFSTEIFHQSGTGALKSIRHENMDILLEAKGDTLVALLADRDTFDLRNRLLQFSHQVPPISESIYTKDDKAEIYQKKAEEEFLNCFNLSVKVI